MKSLDTIYNLIENNKTTTFVSYIDLDGNPVCKAMLTPRKMEGLKYIYFSTNTSSNKVKSYLTNNKGSIYFFDKRFYRAVSLVGTVEVLTDHDTKAMIWRDGDTRFYQKGVDDPDYCVLKFTITHGRLYSSSHNEDFEIK